MSESETGWAHRPRLDVALEELALAAAAHAQRFFMAQDDVHAALKKIAKILQEDEIPYAVIGAMALNAYGYRRVTMDVDLLLSRQGLGELKRRHLGRGYVEKFPGSKSLRDTENGVPIDIVLAGEFPGDGRPKPVAFPDPATSAIRGQSIALLPLAKLVELKLASGLTATHRLKDLADVLELIRAAGLPLDLLQELDPFVQDKYRELWQAAQAAEEGES